MTDVSNAQLAGYLFTALGGALGSFIATRIGDKRLRLTREELRVLIRNVYVEQSQQIRDRIDAIEVKMWGNARRWHLAVDASPQEDSPRPPSSAKGPPNG